MDHHLPPQPRSGIGGYDVIVRRHSADPSLKPGRAGTHLSKSAIGIRGNMDPGSHRLGAPRFDGSAGMAVAAAASPVTGFRNVNAVARRRLRFQANVRARTKPPQP